MAGQLEESTHDHVKHNIRSLVQDMMGKHMYEGAIFYANKLAIVSNYAPKDSFLLANALFVDNQYHRCLELLESRGFVDVDVRFRVLAARCLVATKAWEACVQILGGNETDDINKVPYAIDRGSKAMGSKLDMGSVICAILGRAYEQMESFEKSIHWYKQGVFLDPYNTEAFSRLINSSRINDTEEYEIVSSVVSMLPEAEPEWLKNLYWSMCKGQTRMATDKVRAAIDALDGKKSDQSNSKSTYSTRMAAGQSAGRGRTRSSSRRQTRFSGSRGTAPADGNAAGTVEVDSLWKLSMDSDVVAGRTRLLLREGKYNEAHVLAKSIIDRDSYNTSLLPLYLSIAVKLGKKNDLFLLGHKLMKNNPGSAEAWFASGCYYYVTEQYSSARQYFGKATTLDRLFAPAWIGFAHSFACMDETDQAMAAYRTAARLFPGLYEPILGMSLEYARMNNMGLAEKMCKMACDICPDNPFLLHETGTLAYKNGRYGEARTKLEQALELLERQITVINSEADDVREVALVNLGHTYRKMNLYHQSIQVLEKALALQPYQAGTYSAIAYAHQLAGHHDDAVDFYHKALSIHPEDQFSIGMLQIALKDSESMTLDTIIRETEEKSPLSMMVD